MTVTEALTEAPVDPGVTRTEITVGTSDLRQALRAVVVHAGTDKEVPVLQRVRAVVRGDVLLVAATNRYTVGLAVVSVWANTYGDDGVIIDLPLPQVAETLAMFRAPTSGDDDAGDDDLRIRLTDRYLTMTDTAGLFPGKEVTWPCATPEDTFPDLPLMVGRLLTEAGQRPNALHTNGKLLALFKTAATVYSAPVILEPTKDEAGALVVSVGESFVGALMPIRPTDEEVAQQEAWRAAWHRRLPVVDPDTGEILGGGR